MRSLLHFVMRTWPCARVFNYIMIAKISGQIDRSFESEDSVLVMVGEIGYEVLLPGCLLNHVRLSPDENRRWTFYTLQYLEGAMGNNTLIPRILGFSSLSDKAFFSKFIKVPGIGMRKALKALVPEFSSVAAAIEEGNVKFLTSLPEIGKRTAEKIVAELKGRVGDWAIAGAVSAVSGVTGQVGAGGAPPLSGMESEVLAVLLKLGYKRAEADEMIASVSAKFPDIKESDEFIQEIFKLKTIV